MLQPYADHFQFLLNTQSLMKLDLEKTPPSTIAQLVCSVEKVHFKHSSKRLSLQATKAGAGRGDTVFICTPYYCYISSHSL